jgi:ATP synthase protein I
MKQKYENIQTDVKRDVKRLKKAERERSTLLAQTIYLGTIGIMIALPIVIGAYLGSWLDDQLSGFSVSWTISLIVLGVLVGAINVVLLIREH